MTPKTTAFGNFIRSMEKESGKTGDELRAILKGAGYKTFELHKTHLYRSAIAAFCIAEEEAKVERFKSPDPCPVQGCTGYKDRSNRYWPWVCTVGGLRHHLADRAFHHTGIPHQELIGRIENDILAKNKEEEENKQGQSGTYLGEASASY
jgi:hypothetical protein